MPPTPKPKAPAKGKPVRQINGFYNKDDGSSSARRLLTADSLVPSSTFLAVDVSSKSAEEAATIAAAFKEYQQAFAEHARQFPTITDWLSQRGIQVDVKSFKAAGFRDPQVTEV